MVSTTSEQLGQASAIHPTTAHAWYGVGTGFGRYPNELGGLPGVRWLGMQSLRYPLAQDMFPLALQAWQRQEWLQPAEAIPIYLRDNVATPPAK